MLTTTRYESLKFLLNENYNLSAFQEGADSEYFMIDTNSDDLAITVFQHIDKLEVYVEKRLDDEWYGVEKKFYKTPKGAYNMIYRVLQ